MLIKSASERLLISTRCGSTCMPIRIWPETIFWGSSGSASLTDATSKAIGCWADAIAGNRKTSAAQTTGRMGDPRLCAGINILPSGTHDAQRRSERGERTQREAGAADDGDGSNREHEITSIQPCGGPGNGLQILIVQQVDSHRGDAQRVNRQRDAFDARRRDVLR